MADSLGYYCGPSGIAPDRSDYYVVRPTYNLSGMSAGAKIIFINAGDVRIVPPGYFWCERFSGTHRSITYDANKNPISCWIAHYKDSDSLHICKWTKDNNFITLPSIFTNISVDVINAEFIGDKLIEIHFRGSPDPEYSELIPIWADTNVTQYINSDYQFIESFDDANGFIQNSRLGFLVKD